MSRTKRWRPKREREREIENSGRPPRSYYNPCFPIVVIIIILIIVTTLRIEITVITTIQTCFELGPSRTWVGGGRGGDEMSATLALRVQVPNNKAPFEGRILYTPFKGPDYKVRGLRYIGIFKVEGPST